MKKYIVMITDTVYNKTWELSRSCDKDMSIQAAKYEQKRFGDEFIVKVVEK
jgi:hypothetical protein